MLTLNQITYIHQILREDPWVSAHYDVKDWDIVHSVFEHITEQQKKYLYALLYNKKHDQLKQLLNSLGLIYKP